MDISCNGNSIYDFCTCNEIITPYSALCLSFCVLEGIIYLLTQVSPLYTFIGNVLFCGISLEAVSGYWSPFVTMCADPKVF